MDDAGFAALLAQMDHELIDVPDTYGIKVGFDLYHELADRGLLKAKHVDMILTSWDAPAYKGYVVLPEIDMGDYQFRIGKKQS